MIELLRNDKHITLTIHQDGTLWHVHLEDHDSAKARVNKFMRIRILFLPKGSHIYAADQYYNRENQ
jgi:hypothetical protein